MIELLMEAFNRAVYHADPDESKLDNLKRTNRLLEDSLLSSPDFSKETQSKSCLLLRESDESNLVFPQNFLDYVYRVGDLANTTILNTNDDNIPINKTHEKYASIFKIKEFDKDRGYEFNDDVDDALVRWGSHLSEMIYKIMKKPQNDFSSFYSVMFNEDYQNKIELRELFQIGLLYNLYLNRILFNTFDSPLKTWMEKIIYSLYDNIEDPSMKIDLKNVLKSQVQTAGALDYIKTSIMSTDYKFAEKIEIDHFSRCSTTVVPHNFKNQMHNRNDSISFYLIELAKEFWHYSLNSKISIYRAVMIPLIITMVTSGALEQYKKEKNSD